MPVYVCCPGTGSNEPWRYGIQVYERPFDLDAASAVATSGNNPHDFPSGVPQHDNNNNAAPTGNSHNPNTNEQAQGEPPAAPHEEDDAPGEIPRFANATAFHSLRNSQQQQQPSTTTASSRRSLRFAANVPIRRVRHAEIVLVDDVCVAHGRYWLRLRWPGHQQQHSQHSHGSSSSSNTNSLFAGYIAMGLVSKEEAQDDNDDFDGMCVCSC